MGCALNYIFDDVVIRSENAAKPYTMPSSYLSNYLKEMKLSGCALDFGCGKLRYSKSLVEKFEWVTFLDSEQQLGREQIIRGVRTSVFDYVTSNYQGSNAVSYEMMGSIKEKYDFILCSNVLSAIPCKATINKILSSISELLKRDGEALIVNQFRSSYFKKYEKGVKHLYGYLYSGMRGTSYYGILDKKTVEDICIENGLAIINSWVNDGSSYVKVGVGRQNKT